MAENLSALHAFRLIAHHRSFSRAAAELDVSPSALSQSLRQLEAQLGVRLFNRTTRKVALTEAGDAFLARIAPALSEIDAAVEALHASQDIPAGRLRLTLPRTAFIMVLAPALADFIKAYPAIEVDLDIENRLTDIVAEGFDAGIRLGEALQQDMVAVPISVAFRFIVVGAPAYFAEHGRPQCPADLQTHRCLRFRFATRGAVHRWDFIEDGRGVEVAVEGPLIANDSSQHTHFAAQGVGLAYVPEPLAREALASGHLQTVLDDWLPPPDAFYLYLPSRAHLPPKLRAFIDFMRARIGAAGRQNSV